MAKQRRRRGTERTRWLGFEALEERRVLSVSVELASKAAWSPLGANGNSGGATQLFSGDGRYLFFESEATNLVAGVTYAGADARNVYRLDRSTGGIELVSFAGSRTVAASVDCQPIGSSDDGNLILFRSDAPDLSDTSDEGYRDWAYYWRDMTSGLTRIVNIDSAGTDVFLIYTGPESLSADGSKLAFISNSADLDPRDKNSISDVYVFDFESGVTELVSVNWQGTASANKGAYSCQISADGTTALFGSDSTDLDPLDTVAGSRGDLYARNLVTNTTRLVSVNATGTAGTNGDTGSIAMSTDGRIVLFGSVANGIHAADQNGSNDIFVRDLVSGTTTWVSQQFGNVGNARLAANSRLIFFGSGDNCYAYDLSNQTTTLVPGIPADNVDDLSISDDGNIVAFATSQQLSPLDDQLFDHDVYVVNRAAGTLQLASVPVGEERNEYNALSWPHSYGAAVSPDGSLVAYFSASDALVAGDENFRGDVFAYDVESGQNQLLSKHADGLEWASGNSESKLEGQSVSADGRYVVFSSYATNLVEELDGTRRGQVYRYDRVTGEVELASVDLLGDDGNNRSHKAVISADGNVVAFLNVSVSSWGVPGTPSLYVRDFSAGTTRRVCSDVHDEIPSISADGRRLAFRRSYSAYVYDWFEDNIESVLVPLEGSGGITGFSARPVISANGRVVAFASTAHNLHPLKNFPPIANSFYNGFDVFARDLDADVTHLVSVNQDGTAGGNADSSAPSISADGNVIAFESKANDLSPLDHDSVYLSDVTDVFVRDISAGTTRLASIDFLGFGGGNGWSGDPLVNADGTVVVFGSEATDLDPLDGSDNSDVYAFDLGTGELHFVSQDTSPAGGNGDDVYIYHYSVSGNGNVVAFTAYDDGHSALAYSLETRSTRLVNVNGVRPDEGDALSINYEGDAIAFEGEDDIYVASINWEAPSLLGDFNLDGSVDAADYTIWRSALGQQGLVAYSSADGNGDGSVDELDYSVWKSHFGQKLLPARTPLVVDTLDDEEDGDLSAGDLSLREALALANDRPGLDQIRFAESLTASRSATIRLLHGELEIADELEIVGPGDELLSIDAQEQSRVLSVAEITGDVALRGLTLKNGRTTASGEEYDDLTHAGGAIRSFTLGRLFIDDCTIRDNRTTGDYAGGGAVVGVGEVTIANSRLTGNGTDGIASYGGALRTYGPLTLVDSVISGNDTQGEYAAGGGVYAPGGVRMDRSLITGNSAQGGRGGGGGIFSIGEMTIRSSAISGNWSEGRHSEGGGLYAGDGLAMYDSEVSGNFTLEVGADGGGMYLGAPSKIVRSNIANNHTFGAGATGGGIYGRRLTIDESSVVGNGTFGETAHGGGVSTNDATIRLSSIEDNLTAGQAAKGGGIYSRYKIAVVDSTVSGNRTIGDDAAGGGIWVYRQLNLMQTTVSGNSTAGVGSHGGGIAAPQTGAKSVADSTIAENRAVNADGGGLWVGFGPIALTNSEIAGNFAAGLNPDVRIDHGEVEVMDGIGGGAMMFYGKGAVEGGGASEEGRTTNLESGARVQEALRHRDLALLAWRNAALARWQVSRDELEAATVESIDSQKVDEADGVFEALGLGTLRHGTR